MNVLFIALLCLGLVLLALSAAPVNNRDLTWSWCAGIVCVVIAALIAAFNGWAA